MADKKRNLSAREDNSENRRGKRNKRSSNLKTLKNKGKRGNEEDLKKKRKGHRLPNAMVKEIGTLNPIASKLPSDGEEFDSDDAILNDVYEYEEAMPEEESKKNRRYDPVDNYEYELPDDFEDENVPSDEEDYEEDGKGEEEDDGRHARMLQEITGLPTDAFEGRKKKRDVIISEAYPESEYNPSRDIMDGDGRISIQDLLDPLHGKSGFSKLRKNVQRMERKSLSIHAPLPKPDRERMERKAAYELSKKHITRWEPLVKRNREAHTIYFDEDTDLGFSTIGAIASEFQPRTEFEKKIASLVNDDEIAEAHRKDGARLLEFNEVSVEDVKERQSRLAKMRSLLFRHEMKAKRVKKIKSKTYHRLLKKDRLKGVAASIETDPEAAKELAMKQEFKRAEERLTLKHKNSSKWAKRILKRGLDVQDEGTRAAISEQLHQHALLTRKMKSMKDSSSDESSDEDDEDDGMSAGSDDDGASRLLNKAKEKTLELLDGDEELPKSGVLSLPFMVRGMKKRKEAADEDAKLALQEYESSLKQLEDKDDADGQNAAVSNGRRVFGAPEKQIPKLISDSRSNNFFGNSDSEGDIESEEDMDDGRGKNNFTQKDVEINPDLLREKSEIDHDPLFKSFEDTAKDPGPKTTYDVAIFASNSWRKMGSPTNDNQRLETANGVANPVKIGKFELHEDDGEEEDGDSDTDTGGGMVDGILSSTTKSSYELPSQAELIRRAFAGDDVEEDFEKDKQDVLNEENPEPEKPVLLPGWGQWTRIQKKKGMPSWMVEEHESAKKKREEALKKRKDAHLNHVIISEKLDKKAEKLHTKTLPYPYTSKEVFEQSIRMPIGPEYNPATAVGALNRPEVVKRSGLIIKPIQFEDVNPHERAEDHKRSGRKQKGGKNSSKASNKTSNKAVKAN